MIKGKYIKNKKSSFRDGYHTLFHVFEVIFSGQNAPIGSGLLSIRVSIAI